jgi:hypothetical protein
MHVRRSPNGLGRSSAGVVRPLSRVAAMAALLAWSGLAQADDPPVFAGHPDVSRYTKEIAAEVTGSLGGAGASAGAGLTVAAFYARWLAGFAGATYTPGPTGPRERWEARAGWRLVLPEPLFGRVFGFVLGGAGLLFTAANGDESTFHRALTGIVGLGLFTNLGDHVRVRLELREHLRIFGTSDTLHNTTLGLSFIVLSR